MAEKHALIIGNSEYDDPLLSQLLTPPNNVRELSAVLGDNRIGGFDVLSYINETRDRLEREIVKLFKNKRSDDLLLLFFSGHGILDENGTLYLALQQTERDYPEVTAISADFINRCMDRSNSGRIILILDCCYSGAFDRSRMSDTRLTVSTEAAFRGNGYGRFVLTASDHTSYAWEGDQVLGDSDYSVFTQFLIEGLRTGQADLDGTGQITVNEIYQYVSRNVTSVAAKQHPMRFSYGEENELIVALNPFRDQLDRDLLLAIRSSNRMQRRAAAMELGEILQLPELNPRLHQEALAWLSRLAEDPDASVARTASEFLSVFGPASLTAPPDTTNVAPVSPPSATHAETAAPQKFVFINYASEDRERAVQLSRRLQDAGYTVWLDRESLKGGDDWKKKIDEGLKQTSILIALLSPHSVDSARVWVRYEQEQAANLFIPIVPVMIGHCEVPHHLARLNYIDHQRGEEGGFQLLLASLQDRMFRPGKFLIDQTPNENRKFIGRKGDLENLYSLINSERTATETRPIIAIQGMAGSGKTMLIRELVRRMGHLFPGGIIYEHRGENKDTVQVVLKRWAAYALEGEHLAKDVTPAEVRAMLQRFGQLLVVFDDVWANDFAVVAELMTALPLDATRILTTQFKPEAESIGCRVYALDHLSEPDALALLRDRLTGKGPIPEDDVLLQLIRAVRGYPLALELAAGRCDYTGVLKDLVDDLISSLETGVEDFELEIANINADTSVKVSLDKSLQSLLRLDAQRGREWTRRYIALGVFPDQVQLDRELIAAIWGIERRSETSSTLSVLVGRAFLTQDLTTGTYSLHPMLRAYAGALLDQEPPDAVWSIWERYIVEITLRANRHFSQPSYAWTDVEVLAPHIRRAGNTLTRTIAELVGPTQEIAQPCSDVPCRIEPTDTLAHHILELAGNFCHAILPYVHERSEVGAVARSWLETGVAAARCLGQNKRLVLFLQAIAHWYETHDRAEVAVQYDDELLLIATESDDQVLYADSLMDKGKNLSNMGDSDEALALHGQALKIFQEIEDLRGEAQALLHLGHDHWNLGKGAKALGLYEQCAAINASIGIKLDSQMLNRLGSAYFVKADYDQALEYFRNGLSMARQEKSLRWEAENLNDMGAAFIYREEYSSALTVLEQALEIYQRSGNRRIESIVYGNIAACYRGLGDTDRAIDHALQGIAIATEISHPKEISWGRHQLGLAYYESGDAGAALTTLNAALEEARKTDNSRTIAGIQANLARVLHTAFQRHDEACELITQAIRLCEENGLTRAHGNVTLAQMHDWRPKFCAGGN